MREGKIDEIQYSDETVEIAYRRRIVVEGGDIYTSSSL